MLKHTEQLVLNGKDSVGSFNATSLAYMLNWRLWLYKVESTAHPGFVWHWHNGWLFGNQNAKVLYERTEEPELFMKPEF